MAQVVRRRTPANGRLVKRRRLAMGVLAVLIVLMSLGAARMILRQRAITEERVRLYALTCEDHLRMIYVAQKHLPRGTSDLPLEKAVAYALATNTGWIATPEEAAYLHQTDAESSAPYSLGAYAEVIYCFADPAHSEKAASVGNLTTFTSSDQIAPSSYVWLPEEEPEILAACPYHHIAVRKDDGEIVPWKADKR